YRPEPLAEGRRLWGLTAQLYGLRSQRNWGIGDFTDLLRLVEFAAANGAAFVGLNPLHSPLRHDDEHASPYDPSSRRFLNALYLDVESIPDFEECEEARQLVADEDFQAELRSVRASELVDYQATGALKHKVLRVLFESFRRRHVHEGSERARAFEAFQRDRGPLLQQFASFQVLYQHWYGKDSQAWGWPAWPAEFQDCSSGAVAKFLESHGDEIAFFMYLQWNADLQPSAAANRGNELGMPIGIYADLALSPKNGGADTWIDRDLFIRGAHIGAPPDP